MAGDSSEDEAKGQGKERASVATSASPRSGERLGLCSPVKAGAADRAASARQLQAGRRIARNIEEILDILSRRDRQVERGGHMSGKPIGVGIVISSKFEPRDRAEQASVLSSAAKPEPRKGCCLKCRQAYFWKGPLKLQHARCPECGGALVKSMWYEMGPWFSCRVNGTRAEQTVAG